jgi:hypothetical protein
LLIIDAVAGAGLGVLKMLRIGRAYFLKILLGYQLYSQTINGGKELSTASINRKPQRLWVKDCITVLVDCF